jgi:peptidoglycan/LPS O-acetylase OafA/YrhL
MRNHPRSLDGLRGLAAVMVMCFQYLRNPARLPAGAWRELIAKVGVIGQTGVDLFFVLSGFLITRILLEDKGDPRFLQHFTLKRTPRIRPLQDCFLGWFLYVEPRLTGRHPPAFGECWWWFAYLQNIPPTFHLPASGPGHDWSLAAEEHIYLPGHGWSTGPAGAAC